ncbi:hypothetical protein Tco_0325013 [Tanacetum coccineum]
MLGILQPVAGKPVSISEASIISDLQFNDAVGIDVLPNQAIFDMIQLIGPSSFNPILDFIPKGSGTTQAAQIKDLKAQIKQLKKKVKPTEDAHDEGTVKDNKETRVSTKDQVSTDRLKVSTDKPNEGTAEPNEGTAEPNEGTTEPKDGNSDKSAAPTTVFRDDETITQFLVTMSQNKTKQKGFEIKEIKYTNKPRTTIERKVQEEWEAEEEKKKLAEEEATKAALIRDYDDIQARVKADSILAARLQEEEREKFIIEERAKLLHDTIAAQRRFLAQQRAAKIRSRPPTRTQLRNQMMTYLKHVGGKKHSDLKNKIFEEIQVLYEKVKSSDENFVAIGSAEDERIIRELIRKLLVQRNRIVLRSKAKKKQDEKENDELKLCLTIALDEDKEVDYEILDRKYQNEVPEGFDIVLLGENLMIMFNPNDEDEFWNTQQDWNVVSWKLHRSSRVHTLMTDTGLVIHMLVEKKYPLKRKVLLQCGIISLNLKTLMGNEKDSLCDLVVKPHNNMVISSSMFNKHRIASPISKTACGIGLSSELTLLVKGISTSVMVVVCKIQANLVGFAVLLINEGSLKKIKVEELILIKFIKMEI